MKPLFLFLIAIAISLVTRLYRLNNLPISLFGDEVDVGYQAWSLWTTGRDYMDNFLPSYIQSLSEHRAPLLMYLASPVVGILSPSNTSVRLVPAIAGILGIFAICLLVTTFTKTKKMTWPAVWASFFLATSYWHIHYSRSAFEVTVLLLLLMTGLAGVVGYLETNNKKYSLLWPLLALSFYTYSTANLFVPMILFATLIIYKHKLKNIKIDGLTFWMLAISLLLFIPIFHQIISGSAAKRFGLISIFNDPKVSETVVLSRTQPWVKPNIDRMFHNRPLELISRFVSNYTFALSPHFLFIKGDTQPRHSVPGFGQLPLVFAPLILIGMIYSFITRDKLGVFTLAWLFIAPIPSALTYDGNNHATRLILLLPPLVILAAIGAARIQTQTKQIARLIFLTLVFTILAWQLSAYWYEYADHYRFETARVWHYGYQDIFPLINKHDTGKNRIFINNTHEPSLLRFAFYTKLPPSQFQEMFTGDVPSEQILPGFNGFKFGERYFFGKADTLDSMIKLLQPGDVYFAVQGNEVPGDWDWRVNPPGSIKVLESTTDIYNMPYFYLITKHEPI